MARGENGIQVLLVEDHRDINRLLVVFLERDGFTVYAAHRMQEAMYIAETTTIDLVISDIGLPDGTGWELMEYLRREGAVPGIAVSAYSGQEDIAHSLESGFVIHLTKPIRLDALRDAIYLALPSEHRFRDEQPPGG